MTCFWTLQMFVNLILFSLYLILNKTVKIRKGQFLSLRNSIFYTSCNSIVHLVGVWCKRRARYRSLLRENKRTLNSKLIESMCDGMGAAWNVDRIILYENFLEYEQEKIKTYLKATFFNYVFYCALLHFCWKNKNKTLFPSIGSRCYIKNESANFILLHSQKHQLLVLFFAFCNFKMYKSELEKTESYHYCRFSQPVIYFHINVTDNFDLSKKKKKKNLSLVWYFHIQIVQYIEQVFLLHLQQARWKKSCLFEIFQ